MAAVGAPANGLDAAFPNSSGRRRLASGENPPGQAKSTKAHKEQKACRKPREFCAPTDFSTGSNAAIARATLLALRTQASIDLVHVIPFEPAQPMNPHFVYKVPEFERSLRAEAQRQLDELARSLAAKRVPVRTFAMMALVTEFPRELH